MNATQQEIQWIDALYSGRNVFYGDLHNHAASGGTSDGRIDLKTWEKELKELDMDFVAILDHKQVRHMYLPDWKDGLFIGGSEPGTVICDSNATVKDIHYNMVFENAEPLMKVLEQFEEFEFEGGQEGHFIYPNFSIARMQELIQAVKENGGFFVHPHPTIIMKSENPEDYWFADETGIEVFYRDMRNEITANNYELWCKLLALGKRVWACAGEDGHNHATPWALTTIYAEKQTNKAFISHLREGDFVCGSVGIKMSIGDCKMGGKCDFKGQCLVISVGDFHNSVKKDGHAYKLVLLNDNGVVATEEISPEKREYFSYETTDCRFLRAEVFDETENLRIAVGNPIWNA